MKKLMILVTGALIVLWLARKAVVPAARRTLATEALRAHTVDLLAGQIELAMVARLTAQCDLLAQADQRLARADDTLNRLEVTAGAAHSVVGTLTLVAVLLGVGALVGEGAIGAPAAALALLVALTVTEPFAALRRGALESGRTWLAVRRLAPASEDWPGSSEEKSRVWLVSSTGASLVEKQELTGPPGPTVLWGIGRPYPLCSAPPGSKCSDPAKLPA